MDGDDDVVVPVDIDVPQCSGCCRSFCCLFSALDIVVVVHDDVVVSIVVVVSAVVVLEIQLSMLLLAS